MVWATRAEDTLCWGIPCLGPWLDGPPWCGWYGGGISANGCTVSRSAFVQDFCSAWELGGLSLCWQEYGGSLVANDSSAGVVVPFIAEANNYGMAGTMPVVETPWGWGPDWYPYGPLCRYGSENGVEGNCLY